MKLGRRIKTARYKKITKRTKRTNFRKNTKRRCKQYRHKKTHRKYSRKLKYNKRGQMGGGDDKNTPPLDGKINPEHNNPEQGIASYDDADFEKITLAAEYNTPQLLKYKREGAWLEQSKLFHVELKFAESNKTDEGCQFLLIMQSGKQSIKVNFWVTVFRPTYRKDEAIVSGKIRFWQDDGVISRYSGKTGTTIMITTETEPCYFSVFPILKTNLSDHGENIVTYLSLKDNNTGKKNCKFYVKENNKFFWDLIHIMFQTAAGKIALATDNWNN